MKARLVQIGNSRGVRLPKPLIEQAGLTDEVELRLHAGVITIRASGARAGWADAAKLMRERDDDRLLDPPLATRVDDEEWTW